MLLLELLNIWFIAVPFEGLAPEILPMLVPKVQVKLLGVLAVSPIFGEKPLHTVEVIALFTIGVG